MSPYCPLAHGEHWPVTWWHNCPLSHSHWFWQSSPQLPEAHVSWHASPRYPGPQTHPPVTGSHHPPCWHWHTLPQSGPHVPRGQPTFSHRDPLNPALQLQTSGWVQVPWTHPPPLHVGWHVSSSWWYPEQQCFLLTVLVIFSILHLVFIVLTQSAQTNGKVGHNECFLILTDSRYVTLICFVSKT